MKNSYFEQILGSGLPWGQTPLRPLLTKILHLRLIVYLNPLQHYEWTRSQLLTGPHRDSYFIDISAAYSGLDEFSSCLPPRV